MQSTNRASQAWHVYQTADCLFSAAEVDNAIDELAKQCNAHKDEAPLLLCVMNGGMYVSSELAKRLDFAIEMDYLHASRYRGETTGSDDLQWQAMPHVDLTDRTVILVDDILDEGYTLHAVQKALHAAGVGRLVTVVLCQKQGTQKVAVDVDYVGVTVPNRYVFGCGMDYYGFLRNLTGIWAVASDSSD